MLSTERPVEILNSKSQAAESACQVSMKQVTARVNPIAVIHIVLVSIDLLAQPDPTCVGRVGQITLRSVAYVRLIVM